MTYEYEVIQFEREFELDDEWEVAAANLSAQGTREASDGAHNYALIRRHIDDADTSEGVDAECGYNGCGRTVSDPDERCWQHEEADEE
jgi:hypothetical protein